MIEPGDDASVVYIASTAARLFSRFDVTDLKAARRCPGWRAYANAQLANFLVTRELQRRWGSDGVSAVAFHPGVVATSFAGNTAGPLR